MISPTASLDALECLPVAARGKCIAALPVIVMIVRVPVARTGRARSARA